MKSKKFKIVVAMFLLVCMVTAFAGCIPERELLPTLEPTATPDTEAVHKLNLKVTPEEGGTASISAEETKYGDTVELKIQCAEGYAINSVKVGYDELFLKDNIGYITGVTADSDVSVVFRARKETTAEKVVPGSITTTFYDEDATDYGITWHTAQQGLPVVKYMKAEGQTAENADFTNATVITGYTKFTAANYKNYAALTDLEYDTEYLYICGDIEHGVYSDVCSFTTKAENQEEVTFLHYSDTQDINNFGTIWAAGLKDGFSRYPDTDFVLHTGDIVQEGGLEEQWNLMLGNAAEYMNKSVLVGVSGNHDYWDAYRHYATECAFSHFNIDLPLQNAAYGMYYSFDYGDVHFAVLNTGDTMETGDMGLTNSQINWLKEDLLSTDKKWKIVAMHNPLYSPGKYGSDPSYNSVAKFLRGQLNELFSQCGVDLVLNGHDHVYSRTYPITAEGEAITGTKTITENDIEYMVNPQGTVHLESGVAGNQARGILDTEKDMFKEMMATEEGNCYYSAISVKGDKLTVEFYKVTGDPATAEGTLLYSWGIMKE